MYSIMTIELDATITKLENSVPNDHQTITTPQLNPVDVSNVAFNPDVELSANIADPSF